MKFLLLMMGAAAAVATPKAFPCPEENDIYPCVCTVGDTGEPDMDCSEVTSNAVLEAVFQASFTYPEFNTLNITPTTGHPSFTAIRSFAFGDVSFKYVLITDTYIDTIEEEAFKPSHGSLISLDVNSNRISAFPVETLPLFEHLRILSLANNLLPTLPDLESPSLLSLDLSENVGLTIEDTTFVGLVELEELYLRDMGFTSLDPNLFSTLTFLKVLDLSNNGLAGVLPQGVIRVPLDSVEDLRLNDNEITQIHSSAITGLDKVATVDFRNNQLRTLEWEYWFPLMDQLTGQQVVDVSGNSLDCGCDVLWLLLDSDYLDKINDSAECSDGTPMKDTDVSTLLQLC